ncbi:AMP-binding enzyme [Nocardia asiatica]|uniref:AMP-binding enzyme n=1 Tax=Nocardia asiatica TaxID=209252 RepID=UPI003EE28881
MLASHPAVADAALIGTPEEKWGEVGLAFVVLKPGTRADEEDLHGFLLDRIAKYKIPRSYRFVAEQPRNAAGKVLKEQLRYSVRISVSGVRSTFNELPDRSMRGTQTSKQCSPQAVL